MDVKIIFVIYYQRIWSQMFNSLIYAHTKHVYVCMHVCMYAYRFCRACFRCIESVYFLDLSDQLFCIRREYFIVQLLRYRWGNSEGYRQLLLILSQWRHNEHDGVSNHQSHDCLLNGLFRRRSKIISKLRVTGFCITMVHIESGVRCSWDLSLLWLHNERDGVSNHQGLAQIKENIKAPRHWPFVRGIHWSPVNSSHTKGQ